MDLNNLRDQVSNLTLYDLKAGVRKVQNAVMNYTEMEAKVREATNNEPWGSSSTTMQEIANGTYSYQLLNEIMPMIYKRFTEKSAEEWRQIYKALQLLEFLVKNGSERVVDDARSHLSLLKMLRQFHYIDPNGKDQGINVRNRAKELGELLGDVDRIRSERKKARANKNKFGGVEGGRGFSGGFSAGGSRYGGFGSEDAGGYGGYSGGVYGDGGGFGGQASSDFSSGMSGRRDRFEEYDEYDEDTTPTHTRPKPSSTRREAKKPEPPKPKEPEVDLFDFGDEPLAAPAPAPSASKAPAAPSAMDDFGTLQSGGADDDDDFDDFQSAAAPAQLAQPAPKPMGGLGTIPPPAPMGTQMSAPMSAPMSTQIASPPPQQPAAPADAFSGLMSGSSNPAPSGGSTFSPAPSTMSPAPAQQPMSTGYQAAAPNYFTSVQAGAPASSASTPGAGSPAIGNKPAAGSKAPASGDAFSSLLSGSMKKPAAQPQKGLTMADMAKQKASAGIWGAPAQSTSAASAPSSAQPKTGGSAMDDLLG